jgi:hypothetical protein
MKLQLPRLHGVLCAGHRHVKTRAVALTLRGQHLPGRYLHPGHEPSSALPAQANQLHHTPVSLHPLRRHNEEQCTEATPSTSERWPEPAAATESATRVLPQQALSAKPSSSGAPSAKPSKV